MTVIQVPGVVRMSIEPDENGCWPWPGVIDSQGYGKRTGANAHRYVWEQLRGPIPPGLHLDHTCCDRRVCPGGQECPHRRCVNPDHLEPVTPLENSLRATRHLTECSYGHPFNEVNTYFPPGSNERVCRICRNRRHLKHRLKKRAERARARVAPAAVAERAEES